MKSELTVAVLIPTYRPDKRFSRILSMLQRQTYPVQQIVIMNTEESLWNKTGYEGIPGLEVHHVTREAFDHGKTRSLGMEYVQTDICVCMTQDAVPADERLIEQLVQGFRMETEVPVAAVYARQLPAPGCDAIERITREFNYPAKSRLKTKEDLPELGIKTYFCSNACAAYDMELYRRQGGFIQKTIFNEDMIFAAGAIQAGLGICYASQAKVLHSHNYTAAEQLRRNFDLAVSQADHPEVFEDVPSEGEGIRMVKTTAMELWNTGHRHLLPKLVIHSGFKYLGYRLGRRYQSLPKSWIRKLTMNQNYWR